MLLSWLTVISALALIPREGALLTYSSRSNVRPNGAVTIKCETNIWICIMPSEIWFLYYLFHNIIQTKTNLRGLILNLPHVFVILNHLFYWLQCLAINWLFHGPCFRLDAKFHLNQTTAWPMLHPDVSCRIWTLDSSIWLSVNHLHEFVLRSTSTTTFVLVCGEINK